MDMKDLKEIIAQNLVRLRQQAGLTQLKLAEMLNYSDKAVSKWERGESIPDLRVLVQLAEIYHIKVDDIITEQPEGVVKPKLNLGKKRLLIVLLSVGLVWFVATGVFAIVYFTPTAARYAWMVYVVAPLATSIVLTVFSSIWGTKLTTAISCSLILWSVVAIFHVFFAVFATVADKWWLFYVVAAPLQLLIVLWFFFRKVK